ncbi:MAG: tetratricopeptide repeat protein [Nitrospirae bacterium]|nr:tetratricopeptide repeat protein [Nitrospirota bacterium]
MQNTAVRPRYRPLARFLSLSLAAALTMGAFASAEDLQPRSETTVAERAKAVWESGAIHAALEILDQGIHDHPSALTLHKLRGDILATSRDPREAVAAYETVLAKTPTALDVRWAKWSVLTRWGQGEESVDELRHMAQVDVQNPLIHLRLAQELRKLDRLEESLAFYAKAVELVPDMLGWRLAMARARFDLLNYQDAEADVQYVLHQLPPDSPLELPAANLLSQIRGISIDRGRRFDPVLSRDMTAAQRKEWAAIRAEAWRLFSTGHYQEAEPIYRRLLALNPNDPLANHQLGLTLMQLSRCKEALTVFGKISNLNPSDEDYADTVFRMGQCLVELEQWEEAFVHFQILYEAAVEFEKHNKNMPLPPDTRVLDKKKITRWIEKVRPHVPELAKLTDEATNSVPSNDPSPATVPPEEDLYLKVVEQLKPQKPLDQQASLMGRDADFSWFRFVIPTGKVVRDDFPTGAHEFIPLYPGDSFPTTQKEIYLVFRLVSSSYDAVPLTAQCSPEASGITGAPRAIAQDHVMTTMNDQSGYFLLSPPETGWTVGLYHCGLFAGERTSADTLVDDVRFRIVTPTGSP